MARRKAANGLTIDSSEATDAATEPSTNLTLAPLPDAERDPVKVNNASASELKTACDDALKRFLSRPDLFKQIHTHTDVRLGLGWAAVIIALGTGLYGYYVEFEQAKPLVWTGVSLYVVLTTLQTLYAYFVERDTVFVGKRKTLDKRIVTERVTIASRTNPSSPKNAPAYSIKLSFVRSSNGGKSLLGKSAEDEARPYTAFFDSEGTMDQPRFESWVGDVVGRAMEKAE
ncbi:unnamed protein product [Peniophora sp. CBMAI 1063]|nr:unnamed protein product [Peniophora sp. CBMAI 1063]